MSAHLDESACIGATLRFFRALDARDHAACVAAFAPGGTWHRQGQALSTPEAIAASLEKRPADRVTAHLITNLIADAVGPDRIAVRFLLTAYDGAIPADGGPPPARLANVLDGRDEYVRTPAGWRLAEKRTKPVFKAG
ncbi:MAG: nuclear transport factor 2 family protein [Burkholderiales bacterium]|jgi:hypothetical protein